MSASGVRRVAVVACGVIGRSWIRVFARAGLETRVHDADAAQLEAAMDWVERSLAQDVADGFVEAADARAQRGRVRACAALAEALDGADYVQESGPERLEVKRAIYRELDAGAGPKAILASSTSTLDPTKIAEGLPGARRCIVAHPTNPPHIVPAVEVLPGAETDPEVTRRTTAFLREVGQAPVTMHRYAFGFLMNRMQAALVREAIHIVDSGIADVDAVDAVIRDGLGLRWALLGPFGVANTNADGGVREYYTRYTAAFLALMADLGETPSFDEALIERIAEGTDAMEGAPVADVARWRDRLVQRIRRLKAEEPHP